MLPARHVTCEVVALRTRPLDPVFLDALERAGELRAGAPEPWQRGTGRPEPAQPARPDLGHAGARRLSATRRRRPRTTPCPGTSRPASTSAGGVAPPRRRGAARRLIQTVVMPSALRRHVVVEQALGDVQDLLRGTPIRSCA